mgnify:CR=1 FL=1
MPNKNGGESGENDNSCFKLFRVQIQLIESCTCLFKICLISFFSVLPNLIYRLMLVRLLNSHSYTQMLRFVCLICNDCKICFSSRHLILRRSCILHSTLRFFNACFTPSFNITCIWASRGQFSFVVGFLFCIADDSLTKSFSFPDSKPLFHTCDKNVDLTVIAVGDAFCQRTLGDSLANLALRDMEILNTFGTRNHKYSK